MERIWIIRNRFTGELLTFTLSAEEAYDIIYEIFLRRIQKDSKVIWGDAKQPFDILDQTFEENPNSFYSEEYEVEMCEKKNNLIE